MGGWVQVRTLISGALVEALQSGEASEELLGRHLLIKREHARYSGGNCNRKEAARAGTQEP
eukprot:4019028-Alexandrium_andersonii.AAC.1